ncbi:VCBS domain-containing protein, partial [Allorhizobium pseudoryzae]|uniref:VCBS domain-containing protein n=1 Tax=Allorhizobium pseudoryzae TaxID=379684 RepID=UPI003D0288F7
MSLRLKIVHADGTAEFIPLGGNDRLTYAPGTVVSIDQIDGLQGASIGADGTLVLVFSDGEVVLAGIPLDQLQQMEPMIDPNAVETASLGGDQSDDTSGSMSGLLGWTYQSAGTSVDTFGQPIATGLESALIQTGAGLLVNGDGTRAEESTLVQNAVPVIAGTARGTVVEDLTPRVSGTLTISDADAGQSLFMAQADQAGLYGRFTLLSDGSWSYVLDNGRSEVQALGAGQNLTESFVVLSADGTASQTVTVAITGTNDAPVVSGAVLGTATEDGATVSVNALANASDVDVGTVLSVVDVPTSLPAGVSFDAGTQSFRLDPSVSAYQSLASGQTTEVIVRYGVSDGTATTPAEVHFTVTGTNDAPVVSGAVLGAATEDGATVSVNALANASDVDAGTVLSVVDVPTSLPAGVSFDAGTQSFRLDPSVSAYQSLASGQTTEVIVRYGVSDGTATTPAEVHFTVTGTNDAPVVTADHVSQTAEEGSAFSYVVPEDAFTDVDAGEVLSFEASGLPAWLSFDGATRTFSGTPVNGDVGSFEVTLTARDGAGATAVQTITFSVGNVNDAPVVTGAVLGTATEDGTVVSINALANASDVDVGTVLSVVDVPTSLPAGVSFDAGTQSFRLDPSVSAYQSLAAGQTTEVLVRYGVSDGTATTPAEVRFTVTGTNDAPVVTADHVIQTAEEGSAFSYVVPADAFTDVDAGEVLSFEASGLPAWLSFDGATRTFSGTPANGDVGSFEVTLTARDGAGATAVQTITFSVGNVNDAPVVTGAVLGAATEDGTVVSINALANASDVDVGTVLSVVAPSELPAGVSFDAGTQSFRLDPSVSAYQSLAAGQTTEVTVSYGVSDGTATTPAEVRFTVTGTNDAPVVSGAVLGSATEDGTVVSINALTNASDVDAGTVLSVVAPSELPAGVSFDAGTQSFRLDPSVSAYQSLAAGQTTEVIVRYGVSDGTATTPAEVHFTVTGTNDAPVLDASADLAVTVAEDAGVPQGAVGFLVSEIVDLTSNGGTLDNV